MTVHEFRYRFPKFVLEGWHGAWTLLSPEPVGVMFGVYFRDRLFLDVEWFPWASKRARLESAVHFVNETRKEITMLEFGRDVKFLEYLAKLGLARRVGTSYGPEQAIFESRRRW